MQKYIFFLLLFISLSGYSQKKSEEKSRALSTCFIYSNFFFAEDSFVEQKLLLYDFLSPRSYSNRTTYYFRKKRFEYSFDAELGMGSHTIQEASLDERIENIHVRIGGSVGYIFKSPIYQRYEAVIGVGANLLYGDFRRINDIGNGISSYANDTFWNHGLKIFMDTNIKVTDKLKISVPLNFNYYIDSRLLVYDVGIGVKFKI